MFHLLLMLCIPWSADLVQQGISEKVAMVVTFLSTFVTGYVLAYIRSWRLALALSSILPCIVVTAVGRNKIMSRCKLTSLQHVADSGSLAEEAISTVRTAQAFGTRIALGNIYNTHIEKSEKADRQAALVNGASFAVSLFVVYSAYALAFSFGTTLINEGHGQLTNTAALK
jgi:ATP-binding cassette subfamily B (MDR/TAP) protein 1